MQHMNNRWFCILCNLLKLFLQFLLFILLIRLDFFNRKIYFLIWNFLCLKILDGLVVWSRNFPISLNYFFFLMILKFFLNWNFFFRLIIFCFWSRQIELWSNLLILIQTIAYIPFFLCIIPLIIISHALKI